MAKTISKGATPKIAPKFQFVQTRQLRQIFDLGKHQRLALKARLPKGIYWIQPGRAILWNEALVTDYLLNGDSPSHQRLVEAYLSTLPRSAEKSPVPSRKKGSGDLKD